MTTLHGTPTSPSAKLTRQRLENVMHTADDASPREGKDAKAEKKVTSPRLGVNAKGRGKGFGRGRGQGSEGRGGGRGTQSSLGDPASIATVRGAPLSSSRSRARQTNLSDLWACTRAIRATHIPAHTCFGQLVFETCATAAGRHLTSAASYISFSHVRASAV